MFPSALEYFAICKYFLNNPKLMDKKIFYIAKNYLDKPLFRGYIEEKSRLSKPRGENEMMDPKKMGKQMIEFYRTNFDTSFSAMMTLREQMESMANMYWGQMVNLPEEAKKGLNEWTKSYKKNCEEFKKVVDDGFKNLESFSA